MTSLSGQTICAVTGVKSSSFDAWKTEPVCNLLQADGPVPVGIDSHVIDPQPKLRIVGCMSVLKPDPISPVPVYNVIFTRGMDMPVEMDAAIM